MNYFATNLKFLITRFSTSQDQLAFEVNKKQQTISNWINKVSFPDINDLLAIHQFFGISMDVLIKEDIKKSNIVTDEHVDIFKRIGKVKSKNLGKVQALSRQYFINDEGLGMEVKEPDPVASWAVMGQLKEIHGKLDQLRVLVEGKWK